MNLNFGANYRLVFAETVTYVDDVYRCVAHSPVQMFADDIALYKEIISPSDRDLLQDDLRKCMHGLVSGY